MCCDRCIETVRQLLGDGDYKPLKTTLGEIILANSLTEKDLELLNRKLVTKGFTLVSSHADKVVTKVKAAIFQYLNDALSKDMKTRFSDYVVKKVGLSYYYLSRVFSTTEKITMEKFLIFLKVERIKEMLLQNEFSVGEIAYQLGYSSSQSLSAQFKKLTGKTPGQYRLNPVPARVHFDRIQEQHFVQNDQDRVQKKVNIN